MTGQELDLTPDQHSKQEVLEDEAIVELDLSGEAEGVDELVSELKNTADSFSVRDFKCAKCGLPHGHKTSKHRVKDSFKVSAKDTSEMPFNPTCHCGYNWVAHHGKSELGIRDAPSPENASDTAPIPQHIQQDIRNWSG